jgi:DNA-binding response OmpR family regulator
MPALCCACHAMKKTKKILIIEDEKTLARALELKLTHSGFEVKTVFNGEDGIALLQDESFSLILLDLIMPKMDGFAVLEDLKAKKIKTPVMVLTNLSQENDVKRTKEFGAKEFFIKSNTPIVTIVERVIKLLK